MSMEVSSLTLDVKQLSDSGDFTGIASVAGNVDLGDDIMQPGAFTKTIAERGNKVRLMDNHKIRIGVATVSELPEGLSAAGKINLEKQSGREAFSDLKFYRDHGLPMGMSIGYVPVKVDYDSKGHRLLQEVKLYEVTVTELPMNERAQVLTVKSISQLVAKAKQSREIKDDFNAELAENELENAGECMMSALRSSLSSLIWAGDMTRDDRIASADTYIKQFAEAYLAYLPAYLDYLTEEYGVYKTKPPSEIKTKLAAKYGEVVPEIKMGRMISSANQGTISKALEKMQGGIEQHKSAMDDLQALIDDEAEDCDPEVEDCTVTSKSRAAREVKAPEKQAPVEVKAEPVVRHSEALQNLIERLGTAVSVQ